MENEEKDLKQQLEDLKAQGYRNNILWCVWSAVVIIVSYVLCLAYTEGVGKGLDSGYSNGIAAEQGYKAGYDEGYNDGFKVIKSKTEKDGVTTTIF